MNPLFSGGSGPNKATAPSNQLNNAAPSVRRSFNRFNNSYRHYTTAEYAVYTPFYVQEGNPADRLRFKSVSNVRTLTLNSPLLAQMKMNKDYFFVPYDAILPNTWQLIYKNPSQGDDVPDDANTVVSLKAFVDALLTRLPAIFEPFINSKSAKKTGFAYMAFPVYDAVFSSGGLLSRLGYNLCDFFNVTILDASASSAEVETFRSWDAFAEYVYPNMFPIGASIDMQLSDDQSVKLTIVNDNQTVLNGYPTYVGVSAKDMLAYFRYYLSCFTNTNITGFGDKAHTLVDTQYTIRNNASFPVYIDEQNDAFNYSRCIAYNLICAQFYSNGAVDPIYNAQLYRDLLGSRVYNSNMKVDSFPYNGKRVLYDFASGFYFNKMIDAIKVEQVAQSMHAWMYFQDIFGMQNALKYGDYFTGCHTRPLAVGDVNAPVVANAVSAVDMTKAIAYQRFFNAVVKMKNTFEDYLRSIFGTLPAPDYHEPKFVSHSEGSVEGFEVANTSQDTGKLVSVLHSINENFEFELDIDMPGIVMGIVSFVASRAYSNTRERSFFVRNRFDMFNPMLQTIGDQPILAAEKTPFGNVPFGYVQRYMEYKQRYNIASGAFHDLLRSYCIIADNQRVTSSALEVVASHVCPVAIRLNPRELDRFFGSQSYWSLGNSFHFICEFDNQSDDVRDADVAPSIL